MRILLLAVALAVIPGCAYVEPVVPFIAPRIRKAVVYEAIDVLEKRLDEIDKEAEKTEESPEGGDSGER